MVRIAARITQYTSADVEVDLPISGFLQRRIVFVAQSIIHRQAGFDLPFILRVTDIVIFFGKGLSDRVIEERRGRRQVTKELRGLKRVCQKVSDVRESVGDSTLSVGVHANRANLATEFHRVISVRQVEIINERK